MKKTSLFLFLIFISLIKGENLFYVYYDYEKTLNIQNIGWKLENLYSFKGINLESRFIYYSQYVKKNRYDNSITNINIDREFDLNRMSFLKLNFLLKNSDYFDPLLKNIKIGLRENYYHFFNIKTYFKISLSEEYGHFYNSSILEFYRVKLFSKILHRAGQNNSIYLNMQTLFTYLPNWRVEENHFRHDILSSIYLSFNRYLTKNFFFNLKYQFIFNYSSARVAQVNIKYYYVELPDQTPEETRHLTMDFYNYFSNILSIMFIRYFNQRIYSKLILQYENKEYKERKAYFINGTMKNEKEKDFNILFSFSVYYNHFLYKNLMASMEFKYENRSSNNEYEGYYYFNIEKYGINVNFIYNFE